MTNPDKVLFNLLLSWPTPTAELFCNPVIMAKLIQWIDDDATGSRANKSIKVLTRKSRELRLAGNTKPASTAYRMMWDVLKLTSDDRNDF